MEEKHKAYGRSSINGDYYLFSAVVSQTAFHAAQLTAWGGAWDLSTDIPKMFL